MKIIITESQYSKVMETEEKENFFSKADSLINSCFEKAIKDVSEEEVEDFEDYKSAVLWSTLSYLEDGWIPEITDKNLIEKFFEHMENYKPKIKKHYKEYLRMN